MTNHATIDGVTGDNFWPELQHRIARAARMTPVEASKMMGKFLADNCDRWQAMTTRAAGQSGEVARDKRLKC